MYCVNQSQVNERERDSEVQHGNAGIALPVVHSNANAFFGAGLRDLVVPETIQGQIYLSVWLVEGNTLCGLPHGRQVEHVSRLQRDSHRLGQMRIRRGVSRWPVGVPDRKGNVLSVLWHQFQAASSSSSSISRRSRNRISRRVSPPSVRRRSQALLVHARVAERGQQDKVLAAADLHVDILVVVLVQGRDGARVPDPQVDGLGVPRERDPREGDVALDVGEQRRVLVPEVVVFFSPGKTTEKLSAKTREGGLHRRLSGETDRRRRADGRDVTYVSEHIALRRPEERKGPAPGG